MPQTIRVPLPGRSYDIVIGPGLLPSLGRLVRDRLRPSRVLVVSVAPVYHLWGARLERSLAGAGLAHQVFFVPDGERAKTVPVWGRLLSRFVRAGADRQSCVVALGGGVVGDLAGFAAATFMRGIPVVQVPTTLVAQVDAAIGGKTGVNLPQGKNLAGVIHQPGLVLADTDTLSTLPERIYRSGLYEALKCGAVGDPGLFRLMETSGQRLLRREQPALQQVVTASVRVKARIVTADERESGLRRILNFGHTVGHALEAETGYRRVLHGEAVGLGMIAAAEIGVNIGVTPPAVAERLIGAVLDLAPLPRLRLDPARVMRWMRSDKKARAGAPRFVLLTGIGATVVRSDIPPAVVRKAIMSLHEAGG